MSMRWFLTCKDGNHNAKLVERGLEEKDLEIPVDSPPVGKGAARLFIPLAALENWILKTTDIKSTLLK